MLFSILTSLLFDHPKMNLLIIVVKTSQCPEVNIIVITYISLIYMEKNLFGTT